MVRGFRDRRNLLSADFMEPGLREFEQPVVNYPLSAGGAVGKEMAVLRDERRTMGAKWKAPLLWLPIRRDF